VDIRCYHCGKEQAVTDDIFGNRGGVEFTCPACQKPSLW
jgi:endogenous inhibitor of DNA gyrase (YacG/DUF329 family)